MSVWTIDLPQSPPADQLRRLRVHLSHLHAELSALELAMSLCAGGRLHAGQQGLRDYLDDACGRLLRQQRDGLPQRDYLAEVLSTMHGSYADKIAALRVLSAQIESKGLARKVDDMASLLEGYSQVNINRADIVMGDRTTIRADTVAGVGTGHAQLETGAIQQLSMADDAPDVTELFQKLAAIIADMRSALPQGTADVASDTAQGLQMEIEKSEPDAGGVRRRIEWLLTLASQAGAAGTALASAVTAIRTAIGM